jgi:hypothetical protein
MRKIALHILKKEGGLIGMQSVDCTPRVGDTLRLEGNIFYKVVEVIWCLDETPNFDGKTRVNLSVTDA